MANAMSSSQGLGTRISVFLFTPHTYNHGISICTALIVAYNAADESYVNPSRPFAATRIWDSSRFEPILTWADTRISPDNVLLKAFKSFSHIILLQLLRFTHSLLWDIWLISTNRYRASSLYMALVVLNQGSRYQRLSHWSPFICYTGLHNRQLALDISRMSAFSLIWVLSFEASHWITWQKTSFCR